MADRGLPLAPAALVAAAYAALVALCLWHLQRYPSVAGSTDVSAYLMYAQRIRDAGPAADFGTIRTYFYPLFLALISFLSGRDPHAMAFVAGVLQALMWGAAAAWIGWLLRGAGAVVSLGIAAGLLLNPYTISLVTDALSEGLSLPLALLALGALIRVAQSAMPRDALLWAGAGAVIVSLAFMVRPANIVLVASYALGLAVLVWRWRGEPPMRHAALAAVPLLLVVLVMVSAPQVAYNLHHLGRASPFPACPIGELQLAFGILTLKYDTAIAAGQAMPVYVPNPWTDGVVPSGPAWTWYVDHPLRAAMTGVGRAVAGLSIDHLFGYRHAAAFSWPTSFIGWMMLGAALALLPRALRRLAPLDAPVRWAAGAFVALLVLATWGLSTTAAVETRMNLVVFVTLGAALCVGIVGLRDGGRPERSRIAVVAVLVAAIGFSVSAHVNALESPTLPGMAANAERLTFACYHSLPKPPAPGSTP